MTNEELAIEVQSGKRDYMEELWIRNKNLIAKMAKRFYPRAKLLRYEMDDLIQEGYFALYESVMDYKKDKNMPLISYFDFHLRNVLNSMLKTRNGVDTYLMPAFSIDEKVVGDDESHEYSEIIEAPANVEEEVIDRCFISDLKDAMEANLSAEENKVIQYRIINGLKFSQIENIPGIKIENVIKTYNSGINKLEELKEFKTIFDDLIGFSSGISSFKHTGTSPVEAAAIRREADIYKIIKYARELTDKFNALIYPKI